MENRTNGERSRFACLVQKDEADNSKTAMYHYDRLPPWARQMIGQAKVKVCVLCAAGFDDRDDLRDFIREAENGEAGKKQ